jgi:hypothetical protein
MRPLALLMLLVFAGCDGGQQTASPANAPAPAPAAAVSTPAGRAIERRLALTLQFPEPALAGAFQAHAAACALPACEIVESSYATNAPYGRPGALLRLRVQPAALEALLAKVSSSGAVATRSETAEDLTAPTLDVTARLEAQRALRERLRAVLQRNPAMAIADLLVWEREFARVQGEIEGAESQLRALQLRTGMVAVALTYQVQAAPPARPSWLQPITDQVQDAHRILALSAGAMLGLAIALLPWLPLAWLGWLGLRRFRRWRAAQKSAAKS